MNYGLMEWLGKQAAVLAKHTTSRSGTVSVNNEQGRSEANNVMKAEPPSSAQGHSPTRYGRKPYQRSD